jgi:hypothetical protein
VHPQRQAAFNRTTPSVSRLTNRGSECTWYATLRGEAGSMAGGADCGVTRAGPGGGADGGAASGPDCGAAGGAGNGGPPPPPDPPPFEYGAAGGRHMSRRQRRIKELEFAKPLKIKEPKKFYGNAGGDIHTRSVLVQVCIEDPPEKFPKDERTIDLIGFLMDGNAASWHIQWIKGTLTGIDPKSMTGYVNTLKLRFEDKDATEEAYSDLEKVRYESCIQDLFTKIQTFNNKAMVTGAALKKMILERLPQKIIKQMHTVD